MSNTIFPGNYVSHLNAYREQGVLALPGVEFYRAIGAVVLKPDTSSVLNTAGALPAGTYDTKVLSPDLRQDDKPRLDKTLILPSTAIVYRTAVSAPGVKANAASDTIKIVAMGANAPGNTGSEITLTAASTKFYPTAGAVSPMNSIPDGTALGSATTVQVVTSAANTAELATGQGAGRNAPSAIIVEVCYYIPSDGPDADDTHIPYAIEAGQGT